MTGHASISPCGNSGPVAKEAYFKPEYLVLEKEHLWPRVWQVACRLEELPSVGSYLTYEIADESVVVVRAAEDRINAFYNVCRHRGRRIAAGCGSDHRLRCPFHGWVWDLDGRNTYVTTREDWGGLLDGDDLSLPRVRCETWGGWVFVNFDPDAEPLLQFLGEAASVLAPFQLDRMRYCWRKWLIMPCNWKIGLEAFNEGYHVSVTHSQLAKYGLPAHYTSAGHGPHGMFNAMADGKFVGGHDRERDQREAVAEMYNYMKVALNASQTESIRMAANRLADELPPGVTSEAAHAHVMISAMQEDAARGAPWPPVTAEEYSRAGMDWHIFPNTILLPLANNCLCYRVRPNGDDPESCIFEVYELELYPPGEEPNVENLRNDDIYDAAFWGEFLLQDFQQMQGTHKGVKSASFSGPRLNPAQEQAIANFHRSYHQMLQRD
jgi:phenylpropionate dioxygenase-like ring-hydroxylating dioxygenase large terminal subunit